jgi:hypothetical protein
MRFNGFTSAYVTQAALVHVTKCAYSGVECFCASVSSSYMARSHRPTKVLATICTVDC